MLAKNARFEFAYYPALVLTACLLITVCRVVDGKQRKPRIPPSTSESLVQFVDIQDCLTLPDGIYPDPTDCHRYYHCSRGKTYYFRCYDGFVFHPCALKCSFRDSCVAAESCDKKSSQGDSRNVTTTPRTSLATKPTTATTTLFSNSQLSTTKIPNSKLLRLPNSTPLINNIHSKSSTTERVASADNSNSNDTLAVERLGDDEELKDPTTAEHKDDKSKSIFGKDKAPPESVAVATTTLPSPTSDATMTYIVRVVFAKRTQQASLDQTTTTVASTRKTTATHETETDTTSFTTTTEHDSQTVTGSTISTTEVNVNLTLTNETETGELFIKSNETENENFNVSSIDSGRSFNSTDNFSSSAERINNSDTATDGLTSFNNSSNNITVSTNDTTTSSQTTFGEETFDNSTTSFNETSRSIIGDSNRIDDNALFIKNEFVSTKKEDEATTVTRKEIMHDETTAAESTTTEHLVSNKTLSTSTTGRSTTAAARTTGEQTTTTEEQKTEIVDNKTTTVDKSDETTTIQNVTSTDEDVKTTASTTSVEDDGDKNATTRTTTVEFDGRAREVISNITISCNPAISSAMCESFNNQSKESLARRCNQLTCLNGGMFISLSNGHCGCVCAQGMRGDNCQDLADRRACHCANGGRCVQVANDTYTCMCPLGLLGAQCQHTLADVRPRVSHLIQLPPGVTPGDGQQANAVDFSKYVMCSTNVCLNGGLCLQQVKPNADRRKCFCSDNYAGEFCEKSYR